MSSKHNKSQKKIHRKRFLEAVKFLKRTRLKHSKKNSRLHKAPWIVVAGSPGAGKTSVLANSEIAFNLSRKAETATQHADINWWASESVLYLDLPNNYLTSEGKKLRNQFFRLLKKHSYQKQLNALVLVISVKDIAVAKHEQINTLAEQLSVLIKQAQSTFNKRIPIFITVNKLDLVTGFKEFFYHYAKDERQQPWGISPFPSAHSHIQEIIEYEFDELVQRLNEQLIARLHYEPDNSKRTLIKDFPSQFNQLKPNLIHLITNLHRLCDNKLSLDGIYFTSATQTQPVYSANKQELILASNATNKTKPYFIHKLFTHFIPQPEGSTKKTGFRNLLYLSLSGLSLIAIIGVILMLTMNFSSTTQEYHQAQKALINYEQLFQSTPSSNTSLTKKLAVVTQLKQTSNHFNQHPWQLFSPNGTKKLQIKHQLHRLYKHASAQVLLPVIKQSLEKVLKNPDQFSSYLLYLSLKAYIMLDQTQHFDSRYFLQTMQRVWQQTLPKQPKTQQLLQKQLRQLLQPEHPPSIEVNYQLISQTQTNLNRMSPAKLILVMLQTSGNQETLTLNFKKDPGAAKIFSLKNPNLGISSFYTPQVAQKFKKGHFKEITQSFMQDTWVLNSHSLAQQPDKLQKQIRKLYFQHYTKQWENFLENINFKTPKTLTQLHNRLALLSSKQSPLLQLTDLFAANVPAPVLKQSSELQQFVELNHSQLRGQLETSLAALTHYMAPASTPKTSFTLAKNRFLNQGKDAISSTLELAKQLNNPVRYWLYQLAMSSWQLLINNAAAYIQQQWQTTIWSNYQNQLKQHYPFSSNAENNVSLDSFINFFAPEGLFNQFFNRYLRFFLDTSHKPWEPKSLNGVALPIKSTVLKAFTQAEQLQRTFFPDHDEHLYIPFTLQAEKHSSNVSNIQFQLGSQQTAFPTYQTASPQALTWPDNDNQNLLKVIFTTPKGEQKTTTFKGPWALWKFIAQSDLQPVQEQQNTWQGTFIHGQVGFQFKLKLKRSNNPFDPSLFENFQLHQNIMQLNNT